MNFPPEGVSDAGFRILDLSRVECIGISPMGDPAAYLIRGAVIALRSEDAAGIFVDDVGGTCVRRSNRLLTKNAGSMVTE